MFAFTSRNLILTRLLRTEATGISHAENTTGHHRNCSKTMDRATLIAPDFVAAAAPVSRSKKASSDDGGDDEEEDSKKKGKVRQECCTYDASNFTCFSDLANFFGQLTALYSLPYVSYLFPTE